MVHTMYAKITGPTGETIVEITLLEEQTGFHPGRSCTENVLTINQIVEKHREYWIETNLLLIDYMKAFTEGRRKQWNIIRKRGIPFYPISVV